MSDDLVNRGIISSGDNTYPSRPSSLIDSLWALPREALFDAQIITSSYSAIQNQIFPIFHVIYQANSHSFM